MDVTGTRLSSAALGVCCLIFSKSLLGKNLRTVQPAIDDRRGWHCAAPKEK